MTQPMRLAFCNATRSWGGVKTWTLEFADALRDLGHLVTIYGRPGHFIERARSMGLAAEAVRFGPDFNPIAIRYFIRRFRADGTQAVLVNVGSDLRTAGVAARLASLPLVQRIGLPDDMADTAKIRCIHRLLQPHYLCPCYYIRDGLLQNLPVIRKEETTVIHSAKTPLPVPPDTVRRPLRLVTTSQLNPNKGHEELLRALARLRDAGYDFHWDVAGTGSSADALKALAAECKLEERITWHGFTQNVSAVLDGADVFVLPSYTEGLPNTLLEACARGLVPVARDVGGIREIWPESLSHLLVPAATGRDGIELAKRLIPVFDASESTLLAAKHDAWQACCRNFSLESQGRKLADFFGTLIQERSGS